MGNPLLAVIASAVLSACACAAGKDRIVYVGAHPDDSFGGTGTMILLADRYDVHLVDFTHGEFGLGKAGFLDGSTKATRTAEEEAFARCLGIGLHWLDEIDGSARSNAHAVDALVALFRELKPRAVFTHWPVDVHKDHVNCSAAAQTAAAIVGVPELYFFEVPFVQTRNWHPTYSVDVTSVYEKTMAATRLYKCQGAHYLKSPQLEIRGGQRRPKVKYAETFTTFGGARIADGVLETLRETAVAEAYDHDNGRIVLARRDEPPRYRVVLPPDVRPEEANAARELELCMKDFTDVGFADAAPRAVVFERAAATDAFRFRVFVRGGDLHVVSRDDGFLAAVGEIVRRFSGRETFAPGVRQKHWMSEFVMPDGFDERWPSALH